MSWIKSTRSRSLTILEFDLDKLIATAKSQALKLMKERAMAWLVKRVPFFSYPVVNPFVGWVVELVGSWLIDEGETKTFFVFIDIKVFVQSEVFVIAARKNWEIQQYGTKDQKKQAETELINVSRSLIKFNR